MDILLLIINILINKLFLAYLINIKEKQKATIYIKYFNIKIIKFIYCKNLVTGLYIYEIIYNLGK